MRRPFPPMADTWPMRTSPASLFACSRPEKHILFPYRKVFASGEQAFHGSGTEPNWLRSDLESRVKLRASGPSRFLEVPRASYARMQDGHPYRRMAHRSLISRAGQNLRFGSWMAMVRIRGKCSRVHMETVSYKCSGHPLE